MEKKAVSTFEEAVEFLCETPRFAEKHTLEQTKTFLHMLGDPDRKLRVIHVAGTNGKGSVCAYLRSVLEESGFRVCMFTSPHLADIRERFTVNGHMVDKEVFLQAFLRVHESIDTCPTFFEYLFLMAMLIFAEAGTDYCILETGLGGRLDATNAVSVKELCVITKISLDHMEYLGDTVEQIAGEKAGILQPGVPLVYWAQEEASAGVFRRRGAELGIKMVPVSKKDYLFLDFKNKNIDFCVHTGYYDYISLRLNTIARYQMENASLAVKAVETLFGGREVSKEQIARGISKCFWQGRMEEVLPEVYVDGAHNEDGIRAFLDTVSQDGVEGGRSLLFGVVSDKDYAHMIEEIVLSGLFTQIAIAPMKSGRSVSPDRLAELFARYPDCVYTRYDSVEEAFWTLRRERPRGGRVYAAGSLYLVGEIKEFLRYDQF